MWFVNLVNIVARWLSVYTKYRKGRTIQYKNYAIGLSFKLSIKFSDRQIQIDIKIITNHKNQNIIFNLENEFSARGLL